MSIASRIETIEEHISNIYDTLELGGADLTNVDKNIINIDTEWKNRLKDYLANGIEVIWDNWEKVVGEGTQLNLTPTIKGKMKIDLKGNTSQETTTGKNLLPNNATSTTSNGITWTVNEDGSITANGTTSLSASFFQMNVGTLNLDSSKNYTIRLNNFNHIQGQYTVSGTTKYNFQNISNTPSISNPMLYVSSNTTVLNEVCYPMLVEGTYTKETIPSYEKYTGGIPAPNPDYPQEIHSVSGDNTIKVEGKNLFDGIVYEIGKYVETTGTIGTNGNYKLYKISVQPNTTYTISSISNDTSARSFRINTYNSSDGFITNKVDLVINSNENKSASFTTESNASYILFSTGSITNTQLELGNTATTFEEYKGASYPINLGNIELCKIGDYQDKIYKENDKWYLHKEYKKYYLKDLTFTTEQTSSTGIYRLLSNKALSDILKPTSNTTTIEMLCTHYDKKTANNTYNKIQGISISQSKKVYIYDENYNTSTSGSDYNTWVANNNPYFIAQLETPTYTEITNETLINELENLELLKSYDEQTNITQNSNNLNFELTATALKNI